MQKTFLPSLPHGPPCLRFTLTIILIGLATMRPVAVLFLFLTILRVCTVTISCGANVCWAFFSMFLADKRSAEGRILSGAAFGDNRFRGIIHTLRPLLHFVVWVRFHSQSGHVGRQNPRLVLLIPTYTVVPSALVATDTHGVAFAKLHVCASGFTR